MAIILAELQHTCSTLSEHIVYLYNNEDFLKELIAKMVHCTIEKIDIGHISFNKDCVVIEWQNIASHLISGSTYIPLEDLKPLYYNTWK